jgi:hypothetical protein
MQRPHPLRRSPTLLAAALLVPAVLAACAVPGRTASTPFDADRSTQIRLVVINNDFNDATLFALGSGERRRLGVVTGKSEASYVIPWRLSGPLQIEISVLAAGSCTTNEMQVDPGEVLELQIMPLAARGGQCTAPRGR